jgi:cysteine-rich repeat protein
VTLAGSTITVALAENFFGNTFFDYTVSDGTLSDGGRVNIRVTPVFDPVVAHNDVIVTRQDTPITIDDVVLFANDRNVDQRRLRILGVASGPHGEVTLSGHSVTFTPEPGFHGQSVFNYVVTDESSFSPAHVIVAISPGCGDGVIDAGEQCDDGNANDFDDCTTQCAVPAKCDATERPGGDQFIIDPATGHCYGLYDREHTTFAAAEDACEQAGGHLATLTSPQEASLAVILTRTLPVLGNTPWIGGRDDANDTDAIFAWVTGEPFVFAQFDDGEPDDDASSGGRGDCLRINASTRWADADCERDTSALGRICEFAPVPCGDGVVQSLFGEDCDDGNTTDGDGCSATCELEDGLELLP